MKIRIKYSLLIIGLIFWANNLLAQSILVHRYTEEDGLASSLVYSVEQDNQGYMFFATRNGLSRYDGSKWKSDWENIDKTKMDHSVLRNDNNGNLWLFSPMSPNGFYRQKNNDWILVTYIDPYLLKPDLNDNDAFDIYENSGKVSILYATLKGKIFFFDQGKWNNLSNQFVDTYIYGVVQNSGTFYIATSKGLFYLDIENLFKPFGKGAPEGPIYSLAIEKMDNSNSKIWILGKNFIGSHDFSKFSMLLKDESLDIHFEFRKILMLPNYYNTIVLGTFNKILQIDKKTKNINKLNVENGLIDGSTTNFCLDRENNLWLSSFRGVSKISSQRFSNYSSYNGLLGDEVTSIIQMSGYYYFGHNSGITIWDGRQKYKHISLTGKNNYSRVSDLAISPFSEVMFVNYRVGLYRINSIGDVSQIYIPDKFEKPESILFDNNGTLFVSTEKTILVKSISDTAFREVFSIDAQIRKIFLDKDNCIWASTYASGVYRINKGVVKQYLGRKNLMSTYSLNFDLKDTVLIGTSEGLAYIDGDSIKPYNSLSIDFKNRVFFIKKFKNVFWFGTDVGVYRSDKQSTRLYSVSDGLSGLETNRAACIMDSKGDVWIGTNRGVSRYQKQFDNFDGSKPICRIGSIVLNDRIYNLSNTIILPSTNKNLVFNLEILSFINERKNEYKYKLEGLDSDWSKSQKSNNADILYRHLPPGKYVLKVQAANSLGVWSDVVSSPIIIVEKPFYLSFAFIILIIIILASFIYFLISISSERKYKAKLEEQVQVRTSQLAESELRYKQMFMDNNAYMIIFDPSDGKMMDANPSAMTFYGISKDRMANSYIYDFIGDYIDNKQEYLASIQNQRIISGKHKAAGENIRDVVVHQSIININTQSLIFAIIEDVTERKTVEEKLRSLNLELEEIVGKRTIDLENTLDELKTEISIRKKTEEELFITNQKLHNSLEKERELGELKSRFISMISHEYRTPLTVILSSAYLVKESLKRGLIEEIDRHLFKIHSSVTAMSRLLDDVLTYGKAEEGTLDVKASRFNLIELIGETINEINTIDRNKHIVDLKAVDEYFVKTDRFLIKQIITNVLHNAAKFSDNGTKINIELKVFKNDFTLIISDEGKGISDDDLPLIFTPFFRNEKSIGIIPGTGLGLPIVKRCVDLLKGSIKVNNKLEQGVAFTITIPINYNGK